MSVPESEASKWIKSGQLPGLDRPLVARRRLMDIERLKDRRPSVVEPMVAAAQEDGKFWANSDPAAWTVDRLLGPDITDKETILTLASMSANAYETQPGEGNWRDVGGGFNKSADFGWENDGIRGYIYVNEDASLVTISFKGGSPKLGWIGGGETSDNDRDNVNLLFSCCCGQGSFLSHRVCTCASFDLFTGYTCNSSCVSTCLKAEERYYPAAQHVYSNVSVLYPKAEIWVTGHSLGGTMTSLLGQTYGLPAVTFETPPEALPSDRLGLPTPPGTGTPQMRNNTGAYHFGITSDPIYTGSCRGLAASCALAGYAFDSACHTGMKCIYDVVKDLGWWSSVRTHSIDTVIRDVIMRYDSVPDCEPFPDCQDCSGWKDTDSSPPTSTKTSTITTTTCHNKGWFGCRDKSTSQTSTGSAIILTTTSSTCKTPGWFGCHDKSTTTTNTPKPTGASLPRRTGS
jgi:lipase ATG15